jgi:hypothetical protein
MPYDIPATPVTVALGVTAVVILGIVAALIGHDGGDDRGATIYWSPIADLAGVAEAAAEKPADLRGDYSIHHLRLHLASEHVLVGALDLSDEDAEAAHRYDHTNPETAGHHSIDQLNWTLAGAQRAGNAAEEPRRSLAPAWHELIKQINDTREMPPVVPGRHTPKHARNEAVA